MHIKIDNPFGLSVWSIKQELENREVPIFNSKLVLLRQRCVSAHGAAVQVFGLPKFFLHIMGIAKALKK